MTLTESDRHKTPVAPSVCLFGADHTQAYCLVCQVVRVAAVRNVDQQKDQESELLEKIALALRGTC